MSVAKGFRSPQSFYSPKVIKFMGPKGPDVTQTLGKSIL